jgi:hypothetical protein
MKIQGFSAVVADKFVFQDIGDVDIIFKAKYFIQGV